MANTITGRVDRIGQTVQIPSQKGGAPFLKRELTLNAMRYDPNTGEPVTSENFPTFEFDGERCAELDRYQPGDVVTVHFNLNGRKYTDRDGNERYFTTVRGYKIEPRQPRQSQRPVQQPVYNQPAPPPPPYPGWDSAEQIPY